MEIRKYIYIYTRAYTNMITRSKVLHVILVFNSCIRKKKMKYIYLTDTKKKEWSHLNRGALFDTYTHLPKE